MKLVIVESPTKAKTISQFLGKDYEVESSYGHIRDLPKSRLGIDVEKNFEPTYVIPLKAKVRLAALKKASAKASGVILATDEDREGEAIAWHLAQTLGLGNSKAEILNPKQIQNPKSKNQKIERIVFHEITKGAIEDALKNPRGLDINLINAQQARRILDRLVGYELSPFLWRKIRYGLSAGRVQSVALRLIVEREKEIGKFQKDEYWTIEAQFSKAGDKHIFSARLYAVNGTALEKLAVKNESAAQNIIEDLNGADYIVSEISSKTVYRAPGPPFTTSTLQQEANRRLGFSAKQTMVIAQKLYENGLITYMRTDSVSLAESALRQAREIIKGEFGNNYLPETPQRYKTKTKGAQEAHEAVRPTDFGKKTSEDLGIKDRGEKKLYELIWKRAIASQMNSAIVEQISVNIESKSSTKKYTFRANGQTMKFDGFFKAYDQEIKEELLPLLEKEEKLELKELNPIQHFTEPPPRYTDATLVKILEANGVGRPSTYAPILSTIQERGYVDKIEKKYKPTEIGILVNELLVNHFPEIVDIKFTALMEEELDEIAAGEKEWTPVIREFYLPFKKHLMEKDKEVEKQIEVSNTPCPHCGQMMVIKFGRMGKFLACPDPQVKVTLPMPEEAQQKRKLQEENRDEECPLCGKLMEVKRGRFGFFLGCRDYPKCKGIKKIHNKIGFKCPQCLADPQRKENPGELVEKKTRGRGRIFYGCSRYPECNFIANKKPQSQGELEMVLEQKLNKNKS